MLSNLHSLIINMIPTMADNDTFHSKSNASISRVGAATAAKLDHHSQMKQTKDSRPWEDKDKDEKQLIMDTLSHQHNEITAPFLQRSLLMQVGMCNRHATTCTTPLNNSNSETQLYASIHGNGIGYVETRKHFISVQQSSPCNTSCYCHSTPLMP